MKSLKGHLLLAAARLQDPNFVRSVVFLVQHGEEGALGLILNRPLETTVRQVCEQVSLDSCAVEGFVHQGGPCEGVLMVLHSQEELADAEVLPGVYFSTERDKIELVVQSGEGDSKFFVGYSGWGTGQLENELESGSWLVMPGDAPQVFLGGDAEEEQWSRLTARVTLAQYIDPSRIPEDPSLN